MIQHNIFTQFKKSARGYSTDLKRRLSVEYIEETNNLKFSLKDSLKNCKELFESIIQVQKKSKKVLRNQAKSMKHPVINEAYKLFLDFYEFIFKKKYRFVNN